MMMMMMRLGSDASDVDEATNAAFHRRVVSSSSPPTDAVPPVTSEVNHVSHCY
jgi:hypothetical protein